MYTRTALTLISLLLATTQSRAQTLRVDDAQVTLIHDVTIAAAIDGRIEAIPVREGQTVHDGELLVKLSEGLAAADDLRASLEVSLAEIRLQNDVDLRFAAKSLDVNQRELQRSLQANQQYANSVSSTELERLQLVVEQTELSIEQARRDLSAAEVSRDIKQAEAQAALIRLGEHRIAAPRAGMVVAVLKREGEWAKQGEPLVRIIDLRRLRVEALIDGTHADTSLVGCKLNFQPRGTANRASKPDALETASMPGTVVFVSPELHPVTGQVKIWVELDNTEQRLRPGMRGSLILSDDAASTDS
jgi:multidrug efflux pump subunit AcrA (membrane-fusion protein)